MAVVISSANLVGTTMTIGVTGHGPKSTPGPHRFLPWRGLVNGSVAVSQFDAVAFVNGTNAKFVVDNSEGIGGGSLKITLDCATVGGEMFPHHEFSLPSVDGFYASHFFKISKTTSNVAGTFSQMKGYRAGVSIGDPVENYEFGLPMIDNSWNTITPDNGDTFGINGRWRNDVPETTPWTDNTGATKAVFVDGEWHQVEVYFRLNDDESTNGIVYLWLDGEQIATYTNVDCRTDPGQVIGWVQPMPGFANDLIANNWIMRESYHWVDITRARAFLGNASTLAACTIRYPIPADTWGGSSITSTNVQNIPAGCAYVYVCDENGDINANGFAYGAAPVAGSGSSFYDFSLRF